MALPLPGGVDPDPGRQQKFDALARAMAGFGGKSVEIRFGTSSLTFTASSQSAGTTVTHGLGRTPVVAVAFSINGVFGLIPDSTAKTYTATTFDVFGELKAAATGSAPIGWIAIG